MTLTQKHPEPEQISFNPVIMAGGLWSDITAWDEAGKEIASGVDDGYLSDSIKYAPRDVWLAELTGGPGTECDTCPDYTYDDVVDKHWPALVGGVIKMTNKWPVAYVGHSNGGRVALDSLKNWSVSGKATAGKLSDGTSYSLPSNPISIYVGVGVPGAFSSETPLTKLLKNRAGQMAINNLISEGKTHATFGELALRANRSLIGDIISAIDNSEIKISVKLTNKYVNITTDGTDSQPGNGVSISKATLIYGTKDFTPSTDSDIVVPVSDQNQILTNIISADKTIFGVFEMHTKLKENKEIKTKIKERLNE